MNIGSHRIQRHSPRWPAPQVRLEKTKNDMWTASIIVEEGTVIYLHSRYDPSTEAMRFASTQRVHIEQDPPKRIVLYGAGCGHHVSALLKQTEKLAIPIEVWETNVEAFSKAEVVGAYAEVMNDLRLMFIVSDDVLVFAERVKEWKGNEVHVIIHEPSLKAMPEQLDSLKQALTNYLIQQNSAIAHREIMQENFARNNRVIWPSLSAFKGMTSNPVVLVSAGPSLAKSLNLLSSASQHCLIGSVGTSVSVLVRHGIQPDFVVMTDPKPQMIDQLKGWDSNGIPLLFLSTLNAQVVEQYLGPKFILYQEGYQAAEELASLRNEPLIQTGGSVSTTLFSTARLLGLRPLCLIGQDLAYTDNRTHVEGTPLYQKWDVEASGEQVMAFDRKGTVISPRNMLIYKKWFEEQARSSSDTFYNATEGGAYIDGFSHVTFAEFLRTVQQYDASEARKAFHQLVKTSSMN